MKNKVYISGKISGIEESAIGLFATAEAVLVSSGYDVINPMKLNHNHDKSWNSYMKEDIKALCDCDEIYMLKNWRESTGAKIEHSIALKTGIIVHYE